MAPQIGPGGFFPTNPDRDDILGRIDLDLRIFIFCIVWTPDVWISRSPDLQIPRFPDAAAGRTLRSQPDPSPNALRDQIRRKGPFYDVAISDKSCRVNLIGKKILGLKKVVKLSTQN